MATKTAEGPERVPPQSSGAPPRVSLGRDFLRTTIGDALLPLLAESMEDVVYEALDRRQVPTRTDFKELRDLTNSLRGQLAGATGGVKRLSEMLEDLDLRLGALETTITEAESAREARLQRLEDTLAALQGPVTDDDSAFAGGERDSGDTVVSEDGVEHCTIPGCTDPPRARGYCARHYQKWRRGTLGTP